MQARSTQRAHSLSTQQAYLTPWLSALCGAVSQPRPPCFLVRAAAQAGSRKAACSDHPKPSSTTAHPPADCQPAAWPPVPRLHHHTPAALEVDAPPSLLDPLTLLQGSQPATQQKAAPASRGNARQAHCWRQCGPAQMRVLSTVPGCLPGQIDDGPAHILPMKNRRLALLPWQAVPLWTVCRLAARGATSVRR